MPQAHRSCRVSVLVVAACVVGVIPTASAQPSNDLCASARVIVSGQSLDVSSDEATSEIASSSCSNGADDLDVWFRFTAPSAGSWRFEIPLDFNATLVAPILTVYDACGGSELRCEGLDAFVRIDHAMAAGQTVWLRVAGDSSTTGTFTLTAGPTPPLPPFDECTGAIGLVLNELEAPYVEASASVVPTCAANLTDLWFSFLAPEAARYRFTVTGGGPPMAMTAYADCSLTTTLACDDNCDSIGRVAVDLAAGQQIRLRAAACFDPGIGNPVVMYTIADIAPPTPSNDDCAMAVPIVAGGMFAATTRGATGDVPAENCFGDTLNSLDALDVWYTFTNTGSQTLLYGFTAAPSGGDFQPLIRLYNVCDGALLDCGEPFGPNGEAIVNRIMNPGESVRIRVAGTHLAEGDFNMSVSSGVVPAANDDCGTAAALTPGINVIDTTAAATGNGAGSECGPDDLIDVWYSLTNPASSPRMFILDTVGSTGIEMPSIVVLSDCGGTVIACAWATAQVFPASRTAFVVDGNETVKVRIAGGLRTVGAFVLNVSEPLPVPPVPANDECTNAAVITAFPVSVELAAGTSNDDNDIPCDGQDGPTSGGVWYAIPPRSEACTLVVQVPPPGLPELSVAVYEGTDCQALVLAGCEASTLSLIPLQANTPYRVLVTRQSGALASPDDVFRFTLDCLSAVTTGETCATAATVNMPVNGLLNNVGAANEGSADAPPGSCNTDAVDGLNNSLYMRWVSPAAGTLSGRFDPVFTEGIAAVYTGACGSLTEVACSSFSQPLEWSVTVAAGQSYLIQYGANGTDWPGGDVLVNIDFEPSCIADYNNSGSVSVQDIFDFLSGYFTGDLRADVNGSGAVTVQDIFDFLNAYFSGC